MKTQSEISKVKLDILLQEYHENPYSQAKENFKYHSEVAIQADKAMKTPENILRKWCELLEVTPSFVKKNTRIIKDYPEYKSPISIRHMICWYFKDRQDFIPYDSLQQISKLVGGKEHTRVIHGHKTSEDLMFTDAGFRKLLTETSEKVDNFFNIITSK